MDGARYPRLFRGRDTVDFLLYQENKEFFKNKWLDILLVLPFFAVLKSLQGLKILKLGKSAKAGKTAKAGKAAKAGGAAKLSKQVQHVVKFLKKSREKAVKKLFD